MKSSTRVTLIGVFSLAGLVISYIVIFCCYAAGLFGDGSHIPPSAMEKALRGTIVMGPLLAAFFLLGFLAWREKWASGLLPWVFGSSGVLLMAKKDAGILAPLDSIWVVVVLGAALLAGRKEDDEEDGE